MRFTLAFAAIAAWLTVGVTHASPSPAAFTVSILISASPAEVGAPVTFTANALGGTGGVTYQWDFGDGTTTAFLPQNQSLSHTYAAGAHVTVQVNVEDVLNNTASATQTLTIRYPLPALKPTNSSTILLDAVQGRVWCVNVDQDTVTAIDAATNAFLFEKPVGKSPRTLAQAKDGSIWVVSQQHPSISVLDPLTGALLHVIALPHGSLPYGICMTPDGISAYVSFQGLGGVTKIGTESRSVEKTATVPPEARGISVTGDGRVFVTRFISPQSDPLLSWNSAAFVAGNHGEVVEFTPALSVVRTINLAMDPGDPTIGVDPDFPGATAPTANESRGVPNYITSLVISPDGRRAWVPSKKDNVQRGTKTPERDGRLPSSEVTYRAMISSLDLTSTTKTVDELSERRDIDNSEMPQAACISPNGDLIFIALQGNNRVQVRDLYDMDNILNGAGDLTGTTATNGLAPQGVVLDPVSKKLFVHNYMGRTVAVYDATAVLASNGTVSSLGVPTMVGTVFGGDAADLLGTTELLGKRIFYNAADPRMSRLGYISCAGCHLDGVSDMRVWDFTNRGEGFRNTVVLQGRGGTMMGNVHWSANFDEIQDFDNDVFFRFHDGPASFPPPVPPSFTGNPGTPNPPMGAQNAFRDGDLDALAAYVASLTKVSRSPFRNTDGTLTAQGAAGEAVFTAKNCQKCHTGRNFTDSQVGTGVPSVDVFPPPAGIILHNVGTLKSTSGQRLGGGPLPGLDTPTLKGLWQSAPYLHDGSAATLLDVFQDSTAVAHFGSVLTDQEKADLVRYMLEIDEVDAPPVDPTFLPTVTLDFVSTGKPYSLAPSAPDSLAFIDRSYRLLGSPAFGLIILRQAEDDKAVTTTEHIKITVPASTFVYIAYDARATTVPDWLSTGWAPYPFTETFVGQSGVTLNYWRSNTVLSGQVTLGGNLASGASGALRNYIVIIGQSPSSAVEGPLSKDEWAHDRDADGDGLRDQFEVLQQLSPWIMNTGVSPIPDEDKTLPSGETVFASQAASEAPAPAGSGGGGGGCGLIGLEPLALLAAFAALARRRRK